MAAWQDLELAAPALAEAGRRLFRKDYAYLATVTAHGAPRVRPVTAILS